jgi:stage II sporulation protein D
MGRAGRQRLSACAAGSRLVLLAAVAAAIVGCRQRDIVRPTPQMDAEAQFWVRVLLLSGATECTLEIPADFRVRAAAGERAVSGLHSHIARTDEPVAVRLHNGQLVVSGLAVRQDDLLIEPASPHVFRLNGDGYRGRLQLSVDRDGTTFDAVNLVPLEPYLAGVVGAEMPHHWEPEALRAQAIAARTYCLYIKNRFGVHRSYDVGRTEASQVYKGVGGESSQVWAAVNATRGMVLVAKDPAEAARQAPGLLGRGLFPAYYSSVCGGHTAGSQSVFGDSFSTLQAVPCPYCKDVARLGLFFWPMVYLDRDTVRQRLTARYPKLAALGPIETILVQDQTDYERFSRLTRVRLIGRTGRSDTLRAEDFRLALDPTGRKIKSTLCQLVPWADGWAFLAGRGWGHGAGMCQHGAQGMAMLGSTAEDILLHYYAGAKIVNVY